MPFLFVIRVFSLSPLVVLMDTDFRWLWQISEWALGSSVQCPWLVSRTGKPGGAICFASPRASSRFSFLPIFLPLLQRRGCSVPFINASLIVTGSTVVTRVGQGRIEVLAPRPLCDFSARCLIDSSVKCKEQRYTPYGVPVKINWCSESPVRVQAP